ncbi:MAG: ABC transporter permease [Marinilabiliales bacterium]|nr:MAG: ABC transporter permease [Marinilabiliales bacterium]
MKLFLTLAWRNIWRNKRRTLISMSSVLFAVMLAITFYSMEKGTYNRMIESMVTYSTGYLQVQDVLFEEEPSMDNAMLFDESVKSVLDDLSHQIELYVPRIQNFALVATDDQTRGIMVLGIDPFKESRLNNLTDDVVAGDFLDPDDADIVVAKGLAGILGVGVGDTITLLGQGFQGTTAAGMYAIKGLIDLRLPEMNNNTIYMSLPAAQWFYMAEDRLTSLLIMPYNPRHSRAIVNELNQRLDPEWYRAIHWEEMLEDLLRLMKFDIAGTMVMMMILYIVVAFGIYGTIMTMMIERQREFAMLISLGMKRGQLAVICFFESLFISVSGAVVGILVAIPVVVYFKLFPVTFTGEMAETFVDMGFEPVLPFSADPWVFVSQALVVLAIAFVIGLYPIRKAYTLDIMKVKK